MKLLALKVDADTLRGTRVGVPRLLDILRAREAGATFLFSLGPDHTGRAIRRVFRPGFVKKVQRTSVLEHYGLRTLLYGTLLPGPDIGRRATSVMRQVRDAGFEVGIHTWDHTRWQDGVAKASARWTTREMARAEARFVEIFGEPARVHGAAGWQMNVHALRHLQAQGYAYASDTRGSFPFMPVVHGELLACAQLPTTLPTLDELIGRDALGTDTVVAHLLNLTRDAPRAGHVFTLHAELEGLRLAPVFAELLDGWLDQGYRLVSLQDLWSALPTGSLPRHECLAGTVEGRSGTLAVQGAEFLADCAAARSGGNA